jgi:pimeloyl-ACP methyl ester carboxylesterase
MTATQKLSLWQGSVETAVEVSGRGTPLVWFHGPWGLSADRGFIEHLARRHTVYAPYHPGTAPGVPNATQALDNVWDLVLCYAEMLDRLGLGSAALVGHSFGGMVAAEIAATEPARCSQLVLIDAVGLWHDTHPVRNWMITPDAERPAAFFANPESDAARRFFAVPQDADGRVATIVATVWAQATTGKFVWPIPDRGLRKHLHRIAAPTLILWGGEDRIVHPSYAEAFAKAIPNASTRLIDGAGHLPHLEQPETLATLIDDFVS